LYHRDSSATISKMRSARSPSGAKRFERDRSLFLLMRLSYQQRGKQPAQEGVIRMTSQLPSPWQRLFTQLAAPAPAARLPVPPPSLAAGPSLGGSAPSWQAAHPSGWRGGGAPGAAPPPPPKPPVDQRPLPSEPPRRALELAWLTWQMPEPMREAAILNLRQTLDWRRSIASRWIRQRRRLSIRALACWASSYSPTAR